MEQKKGTWKVITGFVVLILTVSVMSGAISATDNVSTTALYGVEDAGLTAETVAAGEFQAAKPPNSALFQSPPLGSYSHDSDLLKITVGEQTSSGWHFQYDPVNDPGNFIRSVYGEHYAVASNNWGGVIQSTSFNIDTYFGSVETPDTATLHYGNLSLTRQVNPPEGSDKSFSITFVLSNTGNSTLENVRFFQGIDYDIYDSGYDYAWYSATSDTVWQNDDRYFKNGFSGSRTSSHHDCNYYGSMWTDISNGVLNDLDKHPASGTADCGIALQWDAGNLTPGAFWDLTITFYFGEAAGIEANAGPDQTVGRGQPVTFDASRSSSVSNITSYEWDFNNDSVYDVNVTTPKYVYEGWTGLGEYIVALRVTDDTGRNDTDTVKITVVPNVDLTVSNVTLTPTEINDGNEVIFNATVINNGTESFTHDFYVRFDIDNSYIGSQRVSGGIPAGSSVHILQNWEADAGTHTVRVYADRGYYSSENNLIPEANETNNELSLALPGIPFPDLSLTNLVLSPTTNISDGDAVMFMATVNNNETGATTSHFYVGFEIDGNLIGSQQVFGLLSGGSIEVIQTWQARAGNHTVKAIVDYDHEISESNEINNELSKSLPQIPFPDLIVTNITWSSSDIQHGEPVTFSATVKNMGVGNTSSKFYIRFEIDNSYIGHRQVSGGLTAGNSTTVNLAWVAVWGNHTVEAIADEYNSVSELNETNNALSRTLPEIPPPPQVNVTSPNGAEIWYGARDITWEATSPRGLGLTVKLELYNGYSYNLIADALPNTGVYHNWDTSKLAGGSPVPDSTYYKIKVTATDTTGSSGSDFSDTWFTIWNTPQVEISSAPTSQSTTESLNATYTLAIANRQPFADTFNLSVTNIDGAAIAELDQNTIGLNAWQSATASLRVSDENAGTYQITVNVVSQSNATIKDEITIPTYVTDAFTIALSAPRTQTSIGGSLDYGVKIINNQQAADTFTLNLTGVNQSWFSLDGSCQLKAGEVRDLPLAIAIPDTASPGNFTLVVNATSAKLNSTKAASVALHVSAEPIMYDITPVNNTHTGSTEVLFCWKTSVNSSSEIFIKAENETTYSLMTGVSGISHTVAVSNLIRNTWYNFYVRSNSTHGSTTSEIRRIFIDNGITFSQRAYEFTIERDYNQERTITIINTDDEPHEVSLNVSGIPEDLALNFVGEGSMARKIALHPGESKNIAVVFHAQDAQAESYAFLFSLTNLGAEEITDFASLRLLVHFPLINFSIEEIESDQHSLAKTMRITNNGDPLTDLSVSSSDELNSILMFQPSIDHAYLGTGKSVTFEAIPVLSEGFTGVNGTIIASAVGEERNLSVNFAIPPGKQIFTGQYPKLTLSFNTEFENDSLNNTNPPDGAVVDSYEIVSQNESAKVVGIYVALDVHRGDVAIHDAEVRLTVWSPEYEKVLTDISNVYGNAIFAFYGPIGSYSYKAELVGYGSSTETRSFTVNDEPKFRATLGGIEWLNVSDADTSFDLTDEVPGEIVLDNSPFSFTAKLDQPLPEGAVAILSLQPQVEGIPEAAAKFIRASFSVDIKGTVEEDILSFSTELVPQGNYRATIMVYHASELRVPIIPMAFALPITVNFTDDYLDTQLNYDWLHLIPINQTQYGTMRIQQQAIVTDPTKVLNLDQVITKSSEYVFVYYILANKTMDDHIIIEVRDQAGELILQETRPVHFEANVMEYVEVLVPIFDDGGNRIEGYNITVTTVDAIITATLIILVVLGVGASVIDRYYPPAGVVKCGVGIANPIFGMAAWGMDTIFFIYDMTQGNATLIGAVGTASGGGSAVLSGKDAANLARQFVRGEKAAYGFSIPAKNLGTKLGVLATGVDAYEIYDWWTTGNGTEQAGAREIRIIAVGNCINHAPLRNTFTNDLQFSCSPVRNVEGVYVTLYFPRTPPATYQPFDTIVMLNGHEIGRISDAVPQGYYTFEADPTYLNYAETGVADNTITLDVEGMNRGYYVPLEGYKVNIVFKKYTRAVCASNQTEANEIIEQLGRFMGHKADFTVGPADISFSDQHPSEGEEVTIEATIHNVGSKGEIDVDIQFLNNGVEIGSVRDLYLPAFSSETVSTNWTATGGANNIQIKVNPHHEIEESDYTNNEATKTISVTAPDTALPVLSNPQPPHGSTIATTMPLISADLADPGSGINTTAVIVSVDDFDVTQNATVISSRVWYIPQQPLVNGVHNVSAYAEDNRGNNNSLQWSFTVATGKKSPIASFTYSPLNPLINDTITFNATTSYDPDGFVVKYEWDFGDGVESTGEVVEHSYSMSGNYTVLLRVTDNDSLVNTNVKIVPVSAVALPDLTLGPEDIQFIPPSAGSTGSSPGHGLPAAIESRDVGLSALSPVERPQSGVGAAPATKVADFMPSFTIVNLTYPPTVNPDQTFQVSVHTNYSFETTTEVFVGILDYDNWTYIAGTPEGTTLSGTGEASYTFNLTAPSSGTMNLSADLYYLEGIIWWWVEYRDFTVNVSEAQPDFTLNATPPAQTVIPGASADYLIALTAWNGFNAPVTLSLSGLPSGASDVFETNPVIPTGQTNLTINTTGATPPGNYTLNISGVGGGITHQTAVMLNITSAEEMATLSATIHNRGTIGATSVTVQFFDGNPAANGTQIGNDQMIAAIPAGGTGHAEVAWDVSEAIGTHTIYVRVDPVDSIEERNEGNNVAFRDVGVPGVTCSDPAVSINAVETSITDDPVGDGYNVANAPTNVDLSSAKGFMITATGPNGTYVFTITFLSPVSESFKLFKLPHWNELPYSVLDAYTIQVQLTIVGGVLDPAFILAPVVMFDTGAPANPYPSISGTFNGTITPNQTLSVSQLYLYPCASTGGHAEYAAFSYVNGTKLAEAHWDGYQGDWHHLSFPGSFTLQANETYNYTLVTGSYPQLHHQSVLNATGGIIRCTEFVDVNGKQLSSTWIPAIRLEG
jgi:subtilase family serine protease/uncharacterized membrane protein